MLFGKDYQAIVRELISTARAVYADESRLAHEWRWWLSVVYRQTRRPAHVIEETRGGGVPQTDSRRGEQRSRDHFRWLCGLPETYRRQAAMLGASLYETRKCFLLSVYRKLAPLYEKLGNELTKPLNQRGSPPWFEKQLDELIRKPLKNQGRSENTKSHPKTQRPASHVFAIRGYFTRKQHGGTRYQTTGCHAENLRRFSINQRRANACC